MIEIWIGELAHQLFGWTKLSSAVEVILLANALFWGGVAGVALLRSGAER